MALTTVSLTAFGALALPAAAEGLAVTAVLLAVKDLWMRPVALMDSVA